ncbi:MAG TPA: hypothetical protein VLF90_03615 [Patescibacteria group bacterium]|nr:hypothetical protein [Patescibacteria group bacterium]
MSKLRGEWRDIILDPSDAAYGRWRTHDGLPPNRSEIEGGPPIFKRLPPTELGATSIQAASIDEIEQPPYQLP